MEPSGNLDGIGAVLALAVAAVVWGLDRLGRPARDRRRLAKQRGRRV